MKLNIGASLPNRFSPAWQCVDIGHADICHNLTQFPWPFEDESVEAIIASAILEHFPREEGIRFLEECYRILQPGGIMRIGVPDLDLFIRCHANQDFKPLGGYRWYRLDTLMGGGLEEPYPSMRHYYAYNFDSLDYRLTKIGYTGITRQPFGQSAYPDLVDTDNPEWRAFMLYVECCK
jgi:predicted SAM-dependent methyltransferase